MLILFITSVSAYKNSNSEEVEGGVVVVTIKDATFLNRLSRYFSTQSVVAEPISPKPNAKFTITVYEVIPCSDLQRSSIKLKDSTGRAKWDIAINPISIINLQNTKCPLTKGESFLAVLPITATAPSQIGAYTLEYEILFQGELDDRTLKGITNINVVGDTPSPCLPNRKTTEEYFKTIIGGKVFKIDTVENRLINGACIPVTDTDLVTECRDGYEDVGNQRCEQIKEEEQSEEEQETEHEQREQEEEQQQEDEEELSAGGWKVEDGICVFKINEEGFTSEEDCKKTLKKINDDGLKINYCDTNNDCDEKQVCKEVENIKMCIKEDNSAALYTIGGLVLLIIVSGLILYMKNA